MQFGKRVTRCEEETPDGVTVWFTDGSSAAVGDPHRRRSHSAPRPWVPASPQRRQRRLLLETACEIDEALAPGDQWTTLCRRRQARLADAGRSAGRFLHFSLMCRFRRVWRRIDTCALTSAATCRLGAGGS